PAPGKNGTAAPAPASAKGAAATAAPGHKPSTAEIAARIASKRAEHATHQKTKSGRHNEVAPRELTPQDVEARKRRLKNLIVLGKERGYLTYARSEERRVGKEGR